MNPKGTGKIGHAEINRIVRPGALRAFADKPPYQVKAIRRSIDFFVGTFLFYHLIGCNWLTKDDVFCSGIHFKFRFAPYVLTLNFHFVMK